MGRHATLLTFGPMIDSELTRLLLRHYGVPFTEERHIFGWVSLVSLMRGGSLRIPVVLGIGPARVAPASIVAWQEALCPMPLKLVPATEPLRSQIETDWQRYNGELATHVPVLAYFHLLPNRELMEEPVTRGVPDHEARIGRRIYPVTRWMLSTLLRLSAPRAADALIRIRQMFDITDARIADGRRYLTGDRLSLGDLALASATAPLLLPRGYAAPIPSLERMPPALHDVIVELRERPTARLVQRIYDGLQGGGGGP